MCLFRCIDIKCCVRTPPILPYTAAQVRQPWSLHSKALTTGRTCRQTKRTLLAIRHETVRAIDVAPQTAGFTLIVIGILLVPKGFLLTTLWTPWYLNQSEAITSHTMMICFLLRNPTINSFFCLTMEHPWCGRGNLTQPSSMFE